MHVVVPAGHLIRSDKHGDQTNHDGRTAIWLSAAYTESSGFGESTYPSLCIVSLTSGGSVKPL